MRVVKKSLLLLVFLVLVASSSYVGYSAAYKNLIFPNVRVGGVEVGGLDRKTALIYLTNREATSPSVLRYLTGGASLSGINVLPVEKKFEWAVDQAAVVGRSDSVLRNIQERVDSFRKVREINVPISFDEEELETIVDQVAEMVEVEPVWPKISEVDKKIVFNEGKNGVQLVREKLREDIKAKAALFGPQEIVVPSVTINTMVNRDKIDSTIAMVKTWEDGEVTLKYKNYTKKLVKREVLSLIGLVNEVVDEEEYKKLVEEIKIDVEVESKDAVFVFENDKVKEFQPEIVGVKIDVNALQKSLGEVLLKPKDRVLEIPVLLDQPKIKAGDINNMGIKELIGVGTSSFSHSIPGRVFNVNLAASRINGVVIPPGEEFSFNGAVGQISRATGYQTAYVISEGKTVLGDGGGVCQVSTTVFRAALNAGFPITERRAHAYRVGYYEQDSPPGIDATIFSPSTDFKFLNDTGHHILIQSKVDTKNLTMRVEIYGTSDGRVAMVGKPVISSQSPAPATVYVDDPTLPTGTLKQIDWSAPGARTSFDYKVTRGNETVFEKTFFSNYQPWRAVYLRGTGN